MINVNVKSYLLLERSIGDSHGEFTKYSSYYENRNNICKWVYIYRKSQ